MSRKDRVPDPVPGTHAESSVPSREAASRATAAAYQAYHAALVRYLERITHSRKDAEDAAQEAFGKLLALDHPESVSILEKFMWKTAANCARDIRRRQLVRQRLDPVALFEPFRTASSPESWLDARQRLEQIERAIDELPPKCRLVFIRRVVEERRFEEIAEEMGLSMRRVQDYHARALEHCQKRIDEADACGAHGRGDGP